MVRSSNRRRSASAFILSSNPALILRRRHTGHGRSGCESTRDQRDITLNTIDDDDDDELCGRRTTTHGPCCTCSAVYPPFPVREHDGLRGALLPTARVRILVRDPGDVVDVAHVGPEDLVAAAAHAAQDWSALTRAKATAATTTTCHHHTFQSKPASSSLILPRSSLDKISPTRELLHEAARAHGNATTATTRWRYARRHCR